MSNDSEPTPADPSPARRRTVDLGSPSDFDLPRHFLIVRRYETGTLVGFLCHDGDVEDWAKSLDWGDIVSSHPIRFHTEGYHSKNPEEILDRLRAALDKLGREAAHEPPHVNAKSDLLHAIEVLIGQAYEAGRDSVSKPPPAPTSVERRARKKRSKPKETKSSRRKRP